jgi:hypothetical protein
MMTDRCTRLMLVEVVFLAKTSSVEKGGISFSRKRTRQRRKFRWTWPLVAARSWSEF